MKKYLVIASYFVFFWLLIPLVIFFLSGLLDKIIFDGDALPEGWVIPGCIIGVPGLLMLLSTVFKFRRKTGKYPVSSFPPGNIIMRDVYAIWRHPIYLFASVFLLGASLVLRSYAMLALFPVFMVAVYLYIKREESILTRRFGDRYRYYKNNVNLIIPHLHQWLKIPGALLFKTLFHIKVLGKENIPDSLPFFVVSGHRHYFDPFLISFAVPLPLVHISTYEMFRTPLNRMIFTGFGAVPRKRYEKDIAGTKMILKALENGHPVCMFPEGGRSWTGRLRTFKPEALKLMRLFSNIPIVPVKIEGNYHSWPRWADLLMRSDITLTIGKPFFTDRALSLQEFHDQLYDLVNPVSGAEAKIICKSKNRINHLSKVIYRCPGCMNPEPPEEIQPDTLRCSRCGFTLNLKPDFSLNCCGNNGCHIESIQSVYERIKIKATDYLSLINNIEFLEGSGFTGPDEKLIYIAPGTLWIERKDLFIRFINGKCILSDKVLRIVSNDRSFAIPLSGINAVTIESNYKLQIYNDEAKNLVQLTFDNDSALKWQDLLSAIIEVRFKRLITTR